CRVQARAVRPNPALHGVEEILIAVITDPGFLVRSDIGGIQRAEWQNQGKPAGIGPVARHRVAGPAICGARQIFAALDDIGILEIRGDAGWIAAAIIGERNVRSGKSGGTWIEHLPGKDGCDHHQNENDKDYAARAHRRYALPGTAIALRSIGNRRSATPVAA